MTRCPRRALTDRVRREVRDFYADETGRTVCIATDGEYGSSTDISHLDDDRLHSCCHNLVPLHPRFNRHFGGYASRYGSPTRVVVPCEFVQLDWVELRRRAESNRAKWRMRRAYACVRVAYYTRTRYYERDLATLYEIMAECLFYARHVRDDDLIWGLVTSELLPLLARPTANLRRTEVAAVVRQVAAIWTDFGRPQRGAEIQRLHDCALSTTRTPNPADQQSECSLQRRRAIDLVTSKGGAALRKGTRLAQTAYSNASTTEQRINALEVEPWGLAIRGKWVLARTRLEEELMPIVDPLIQTHKKDVDQLTKQGRLASAPVKIPLSISALNAGEIPAFSALAIVETGGTSKSELDRVRELTDLALCVYGPMRTGPYMLTREIREAYRKLACIVRDDRLWALCGANRMSRTTAAVLERASRIAVDRLIDAKP